MTKAEANLCLDRIISIAHYEKMIADHEEIIEDIRFQIVAIQEPSSPSISDDPKVSVHVDKTSIINSMYGEEQEEQDKIDCLKKEMEIYKSYVPKIINGCWLEWEKQFATDYLKHILDKERKKYNQNVYVKPINEDNQRRTMIGIMKQIKSVF